MEILFGIFWQLLLVLGIAAAVVLGFVAACVVILFVASAVNGFVKGRPVQDRR